MTELEMTIEALKLCVSPEKFETALNAVKATPHTEGNSANQPQQEDLQVRISRILTTLGVPAHIKGYHYLREAIAAVVNDMSLVNYITKGLYPMVAKKFQTTPPRVERAIRHAIDVALDRGDWETFMKIFGNTVSNTKGKPTNSEFIALIADSIVLDKL